MPVHDGKYVTEDKSRTYWYITKTKDNPQKQTT